MGRRVPWLLRGCLLPIAALAGLAWWELRETTAPVDALQRGIAAGDVEAVRRALDAGADPDLSDYDVDPPLVAAVAAGKLEIARLLLERGADPDRPGARDGDLSPLATAVARGAGELQQLLLDGGADPSSGSPVPLLFAAVRADDAEAVRRLVTGGADVDVRDASGVAWEEAVGGRLRSAREVAAKMGVEPPRSADTERLGGVTPLMLAARQDGLALVEALLECGADANATDGAGATPLSHAVRSPWSSVEVMTRLLEAGANPHQPDAAGRSPIDYARGPELPRPGVAALLEAGASR